MVLQKLFAAGLGFLVLLTGAAWVTADAAEEKAVESVDQLPTEVQEVVKKQLGTDVTVESIESEEDDGEVKYKIDGKNADGSEIDLDVSEDGTEFTLKIKIDFEAAPQAVKDAVKKVMGDRKYDEVELDKRTEEDRELYYEADIDLGGRDIEIEISPDGNGNRSRPGTVAGWKLLLAQRAEFATSFVCRPTLQL